MVLLIRWPNAADHDVNSVEDVEKLRLWRFQIAFADYHTTVLQRDKSRLPERCGAYESVNLLAVIMTTPLASEHRPNRSAILTKFPASSKPFAIEPPVSPVAPTSRTFVGAILRERRNVSSEKIDLKYQGRLGRDWGVERLHKEHGPGGEMEISRHYYKSSSHPGKLLPMLLLRTGRQWVGGMYTPHPESNGLHLMSIGCETALGAPVGSRRKRG